MNDQEDDKKNLDNTLSDSDNNNQSEVDLNNQPQSEENQNQNNEAESDNENQSIVDSNRATGDNHAPALRRDHSKTPVWRAHSLKRRGRCKQILHASASSAKS